MRHLSEQNEANEKIGLDSRTVIFDKTGMTGTMRCCHSRYDSVACLISLLSSTTNTNTKVLLQMTKYVEVTGRQVSRFGE